MKILKLISFWVLLIVLGSPFGPVQSRPAASVADQQKSQFQARYTEMKAAMAARDEKAVRALLAPDFQSVDASGKVGSVAEMIAGIVALQPDPNKSSKTIVQSVAIEKGRAIVTQTYEMQTTRIAPDGSSFPFSISARSTDTWSKSGQQWLLSRTMTDEMSVFRNGQTVAHQVRPSK